MKPQRKSAWWRQAMAWLSSVPMPNPSVEAPLDVAGAMEAHQRWKGRLTAYVDGTSQEQLLVETVCSDKNCILGKWIYGAGAINYGHHPKFRELREVHQHFHTAAGEIVRLVQAGQNDAAKRMLRIGEYQHASLRISMLLARIGDELKRGVLSQAEQRRIQERKAS